MAQPRVKRAFPFRAGIFSVNPKIPSKLLKKNQLIVIENLKNRSILLQFKLEQASAKVYATLKSQRQKSEDTTAYYQVMMQDSIEK